MRVRVCVWVWGGGCCQGLGYPVWTYALCNYAGRAGHCASLSSLSLWAPGSPVITSMSPPHTSNLTTAAAVSYSLFTQDELCCS